MALDKTFLLIFVLILFYNNITFTTCSKKFDNHGESRSFIGFGTHTATQRVCNCSLTSMCACCQIVKILYQPLQSRTLCFNMIFQANVLNVDLSLDLLIMNSMTVATYRPFQMCAKIPGVIFSNACVSITDIRTLPGPSVMVCPRMELSTKKENWIISYICVTLSANGTSGMGMMGVNPQAGIPGTPVMPGPTVPGMPMLPAASPMPMMMVVPVMPMIPGAPAPGAAGGAAGMAPAPAAPAPMGPTGSIGTMPPTGTGMMPPAGVGMMPAGAAPMGARPPASSTAAASNIVPRITGAAGSSVLVVMMNQKLASALESVITEASAASIAMAQENRGEAPESRFDSGIKVSDSPTDFSNVDEESFIIDLSNNPESYEANSKVESTTENAGSLKNLKRMKRNYDLFDALHQSNRCERAYRICITRTKHYVISRLRNLKQNVKVKNDNCEELVRIVHEPNGNLCTQTNWNDNTTPLPVTNPPLESHDTITYTDDTLGAIVIKDEYSEDSDFHPQNDQYPIPLLTYSNAEMYPSRIPPIALKEILSRSLNVSILRDNDKSLSVANKS